jgi:hypothetical protein
MSLSVTYTFVLEIAFSIEAPYTSCVYCTGAFKEAIAEVEALAELPDLLPLPSKVCCFILAICTAPKAAVAAV